MGNQAEEKVENGEAERKNRSTEKAPERRGQEERERKSRKLSSENRNGRGRKKPEGKGKGAYDEESIKAEIDKAKEAGDTLGGSFEIIFKNLPVGLGSFVHWDRRLDGQLAQAVMSIPAIKSVEIGAGSKVAEMAGSITHDEIFYKNGNYSRKTNNAGGIEGGMTNGEDVIIRASMKAIPTMKKPLQSVNIETKEPYEAHFERSDTCAVEACAIVAEAMSAIVLANAFLEKFGGDSIEETKRNFNNQNTPF